MRNFIGFTIIAALWYYGITSGFYTYVIGKLDPFFQIVLLLILLVGTLEAAKLVDNKTY